MPMPAARLAATAARGLRCAMLAAVVATFAGCVVVSGGHGGGSGGSGGGGPGRTGDALPPVLPPSGVVDWRIVQVGVAELPGGRAVAVVTQEPLVVVATTRDAPVRLTWKLPPASDLTFPDNGIVIDGEVITTPGAAGPVRSLVPTQAIGACRRVDAKTFTCENTLRKGKYAYTVRLLRGGQPTEPLDPTIINGF